MGPSLLLLLLLYFVLASSLFAVYLIVFWRFSLQQKEQRSVDTHLSGAFSRRCVGPILNFLRVATVARRSGGLNFAITPPHELTRQVIVDPTRMEQNHTAKECGSGIDHHGDDRMERLT